MIRKILIGIGTLFAILVACFVLFGPGYKWKASSFLRQMKRTATPAQLQDWALGEIARAEGDRPELDSRPDILNAPDDGMPRTVWVESDANEPYVVAQWGGGFGHWGLLIGSPSMKYPIDNYYHLEWAPGVYVWHEIQ